MLGFSFQVAGVPMWVNFDIPQALCWAILAAVVINAIVKRGQK